MQGNGCRFVATLTHDPDRLELTRVGSQNDIAGGHSSLQAFVNNNGSLELLANNGITSRELRSPSHRPSSISVTSIRRSYEGLPILLPQDQYPRKLQCQPLKPFGLLSPRTRYHGDRRATVPSLMRLRNSRLPYGVPRCPICLSHNEVRLVQLTAQWTCYAEVGSTHNNRFIPRIMWAPPSINLPHLLNSHEANVDLMSCHVKEGSEKAPKYAVCSRCKMPAMARVWQCLAPHCRIIWCNACASRTRHPRRTPAMQTIIHRENADIEQRKAKCLQVIKWPGKVPFAETEEGKRLSTMSNEVNKRVEFERWCDRQLGL